GARAAGGARLSGAARRPQGARLRRVRGAGTPPARHLPRRQHGTPLDRRLRALPRGPRRGARPMTAIILAAGVGKRLLAASGGRLSGPVVVMDADVLCAPAMLERLIHSPEPNCFLLDGSVQVTGEEQMLLVSGGRVRDIVRGGAPGYELSGESVGFLKLSGDAARVLRDLLAERVAR